MLKRVYCKKLPEAAYRLLCTWTLWNVRLTIQFFFMEKPQELLMRWHGQVPQIHPGIPSASSTCGTTCSEGDCIWWQNSDEIVICFACAFRDLRVHYICWEMRPPQETAEMILQGYLKWQRGISIHHKVLLWNEMICCFEWTCLLNVSCSNTSF